MVAFQEQTWVHVHNTNCLRVLILTECDLCLHRHGEGRVFDLTAEEGIVVQLWVQVPSEHGLHLHSAVTILCLCVVEVVERTGAQHPAWELPADHSLRDDLSGGPGSLLAKSSGGVALMGPDPIEPHWLNVWLKERQGLLQLGVIQIPADQRPAVFG